MNDEISFLILKNGSTVIPNVILHNYHKLGLSDSELILLLQLLSILKNGDETLNFNDLATIMGKNDSEIYELLHGLIEKKIINLESVRDDQGRNNDRYNFEPLFKKVVKILNDDFEIKQEKKLSHTREEVFEKIEKEFGRQLSSFEMEMINDWINSDHYDLELIILALKEAVLSNAYSLKYMDRILINWEKKGIKTASDVQRMRDEHRGKSKKIKEKGNQDKPKIPLIKWSKDK